MRALAKFFASQQTFKNENSKDIQFASYWYIKHNIRRFLCSRTLAPLLVYRKVRHFFKKHDNDYLKVSELIRNNQIHKLFDNTTYSYMRYNHELGEVEDITVWQKSTDLILKSRIKTNGTFKLEYKKKEYKKALSVFVNDFVKYVHSDILNKFVLVPVVPSKLKDYQLNNYYRILENTDIDSLDLVHFGVVKNEMIKRGFLQENITNLNDYNVSYLFDNCKASAHVPMTFIALDMPCYDVPFIKQQNLF